MTVSGMTPRSFVPHVAARCLDRCAKGEGDATFPNRELDRRVGARWEGESPAKESTSIATPSSMPMWEILEETTRAKIPAWIPKTFSRRK
jgi:hypothetical protein